MRLPLYLGSQAQVSLDAGPSLVVYSPGCAPGRYPVRRISRVNVSSGCQLGLDVLAACLGQNIPVTIINSHGLPLGVCFGLGRARPDSLVEKLENLWARPDWYEHYKNMRMAEERRAIIMMLKRLRLRTPDLRPGTVRTCLCDSAVRAGLPASHFRFNSNQWRGMAMSLVQEYLSAVTESPTCLVHTAKNWNLANDVADILAWDLYEYMLIEIGRWRKAVSVSRKTHVRWLVAAFEQRAPRLRRLAGNFWNRFQVWLEEEEPWRRPLDI
jgi:hypothetical protein